MSVLGIDNILSKPLARPHEYLVNDDVWLGGRGRMAWTPPLDFKVEVGRGLNRKSPFLIVWKRRFSLRPSFPDKKESDFVGRLWLHPSPRPLPLGRGEGIAVGNLTPAHEKTGDHDDRFDGRGRMAWTPPLDFKVEVGRGLSRSCPFLIEWKRRFSLQPSFPENKESDFVGRLWFAPLTPPSAPRKGRGSRCPSPWPDLMSIW